MTVVQQEIDAVRLRRDRIAFDGLHDPQFFDRQFVSAGASLVGFDQSVDFDRRFLSKSSCTVEKFSVGIGLFENTLANSGPVAQDQEEQLSARSTVVLPPAKRYRLPDMVMQLRNRRCRRPTWKPPGGGSFPPAS